MMRLPRYLAAFLFLSLALIRCFLNLRSVHQRPLSEVAQSILDGPRISRSTEFESHEGRNGRSYSTESVSNSTGKAVQILSTVPWDDRHVVALWTELECFTKDVDKVVVSAPEWSQDIIDSVVREARARIPHLSHAMGKTSIETKFFVNDRYDVGLWCDALRSILKRGDRYDDFVLLNDSVFALNEFGGVLGALRASRNNVSMTSLSYSGTGKDGMWLESVFRAFSKDGIVRFLKHSCVPSNHRSFCRKRKSAQNRKRCITVYHEIGMARKFPPNQTLGLFPSDVPKEMWGKRPYATWVLHVPYWRNVLVEQMGFPAAKVGMKSMIESINDPLLKNCTRHLDWSLLERLNFDAYKNTLTGLKK